MPQKGYMFDFSGPAHLTSVNWTRPDHRRAIAACLVQGVYALEHDRRNKRQDGAPAWWKNFHFELKDELIDDDDSSIFGAIYEFKSSKFIQNASSAPKIVIALRGTKKSYMQDIKLDWKILVNGLERTSRCERAMRAVEEMVSAVGSHNLWLAGHSLGSVIAMHAGKSMAKRGINLETFLFNPPYPGTTQWIRIQKVQQGIHIARCFSTAAAAAWAKKGESSRNYFAQISSWIPHTFVNSHDVISSGYIGYFEQRETMKKIGAGSIGNLAARNSLRALALRKSEPLHLLPSANLVVNSLHRNLTAHGIRQWWSQDVILQSKMHHYS